MANTIETPLIDVLSELKTSIKQLDDKLNDLKVETAKIATELKNQGETI